VVGGSLHHQGAAVLTESPAVGSTTRVPLPSWPSTPPSGCRSPPGRPLHHQGSAPSWASTAALRAPLVLGVDGVAPVRLVRTGLATIQLVTIRLVSDSTSDNSASDDSASALIELVARLG